MLGLFCVILGFCVVCIPIILCFIVLSSLIIKKKSNKKPIFLTVAFGLEFAFFILNIIELIFVALSPLITDAFLDNAPNLCEFWDITAFIAWLIYLMPTIFLFFMPALIGAIILRMEQRDSELNAKIGNKAKLLIAAALIAVARVALFFIIDSFFLLHFNAQII